MADSLESTPRPGPALSATSDTPDFQAAMPAISASGETGGDAPADPAPADPAPVDPPAPDNTDPVAPPADPEPTDPVDPPTDPEPAPAAATVAREERGVGKALNAKDAEIARLQAERDTLQRQFNEAILKREPAPVEPPAPPVEIKPDLKPIRPRAAQFETPDAHEAALDAYDAELGAWTARQAESKAQAVVNADRAIQDQQANTQRVTQDFTVVQAAHDARVAKIREAKPDFDAVAFANDVSITPSMGVLIMNSEAGPDVLYHLGQNKEEAARIANMVVPGQFFPKGHEWAGMPVPNVAAQARAIGQLEGKLSAGPVAPVVAPKKVSQAPAPVKAVNQRQAATEKTGDEKTADEYYETHPSTLKRRAAMAAAGITQH